MKLESYVMFFCCFPDLPLVYFVNGKIGKNKLITDDEIDLGQVWCYPEVDLLHPEKLEVLHHKNLIT